MEITDAVVGLMNREVDELSNPDKSQVKQLTNADYALLKEMRTSGLYLVRNAGGQEGLTISIVNEPNNIYKVKTATITSMAKKGTIQRLLDGEYIYESIAIKNKYLLTDKGRAVR